MACCSSARQPPDCRLARQKPHRPIQVRENPFPMDNSRDLKLQESKGFAVKKFEVRTDFRAMTSRETGGRFAPTAIRLRAVRRASHAPERRAFAELLGISVSRLSNYENGFPIPGDIQRKIIEAFPWVSRSFLMDGDERTLTGIWLQRLLPLVAEESDTTLPRSRSSARSSR